MKTLLALIGAAVVIVLLLSVVVLEHRLRQRPPRPRPRIKQPIVNWSWRLYVVTLVIVGAFIVQRLLTSPSLPLLVALSLMLPFTGMAAMASFTVGAFGFEYSVFGKLRRTPLPTETPAYRVNYAAARVDNLRTGPIVTWEMYRNGIAMRIASIGDAFIPLDDIDCIEVRHGFLGVSSLLWHHCAEIKSPIQIQDKVAETMARYYPSKAVFDAAAD